MEKAVALVPIEWIATLSLVMGLACLNDPMSYVSGDLFPGRSNQAEQVIGEGPD